MLKCSSNSASLFTRWMYLLHWRMSCSLFRVGIWFYSQSGCLRVTQVTSFNHALSKIRSSFHGVLAVQNVFESLHRFQFPGIFPCTVNDTVRLYSRYDSYHGQHVKLLPRILWKQLHYVKFLANFLRICGAQSDTRGVCLSGYFGHPVTFVTLPVF